jgi:Bacterial archaeo-eukaryotic release factor family 11
MLYVDIPTLPEFRALAATRADACVSIYLPTTPVSQGTRASRIELKNLTKAALGQLDAIGFDKRRSASINNQLAELAADNEFWKYQAMSLGVLTNPETMRTFRLPNRLTAMVEVSDRFHLKPLIRAITFPHEAFVLALSENKVRLVEVFADLPAQEVKIPELPKSAAAAVRQSTINDRSPSGRIQGLEGQKVRLGQYARQIDTALRPVLAGRDMPLILAATEPLASIFRSINTYPGLVDDTISTSPDTLKSAELATRARPILDRIYARQLDATKALFETRKAQGRATTDIADAARAATFGAVEQLLIDIDEVVPGTVDEGDGRVTFATETSAKSYGIIDEIAGRALLGGARVLGVRKAEIPDHGHLAAILRYPI